MVGRNFLKVLGLIGLVLPFTGCNNTQVGTIQISPTSQSLTVGQTVQFTALGIIGHGSHPSSSTDVTNLVAWSSSSTSVATVSSSGVATAVGPGTATISATLSGTSGATALLTVTAASGGTGGSLVSVAIIPGSQAVAAPGETTQFIAIGTTSSGATEDVTSQAIWGSSSSQIATVTSGGGLATAVSQGSVTITAIVTTSTSAVVTGTATFTVTGGTSEPLTALTITPGAQSVSASGQTGQFIAIGTTGTSGLQQDVSNSPNLTWNSSIPTIATISQTGLVTGVSVGNTQITALWTNPDTTVVSAIATVTVTSTPAPEPLLSLTIIPSSISVGNLQGTGNFLAIGTFSTSPQVRDLTNSVTWLSSAPNIFPVSSNNGTVNPGAPGGIVTAYGSGSAVIIAEATDVITGSVQTATATFNCPLVLPPPPGSQSQTPGSCYAGSEASALLSTVTVYNEGLNTTTWLVTAPSATGTPNVIHCGPGSNAAGFGNSVCVATYPIGTPIVLTAPAGAGQFGGWSSNCTPNPNPPTAAGPNTCIITPTTFNESAGAIFN